MGSKHLKQLLNEDQEPFVLKNYIDERRSQIKRPKTQNQLQLHLKKRKPISENTSIFCKNACFFSFHDSPDINRMSPLFDFTSPAKSPIRNSNTLFVHIPSRTAALLLEAALRIQKQSATTKKPKTPKNIGFGFFGSILKRLTHRKKNPKRGNINGDETTNVSVKDILRWDSFNGRKQTTEVLIQGRRRKKEEEMTMGVEEIRVSEMGFSCSCNNSRLSSAWSESNEEKSLDLDTSSSRSEDSEEMEFIKNGDFSSCEKDFCSSPFRFVLQRNSSSGHCTPEFSSPVSSPTRLKKQTVKEEEDGQLNYEEKEFEEEEEKEQFSPVSVLDPQFEEEDDEDDEDRHEEEDEEEEEEEEERDGHQLERSFAVVHRARQQLLHKLRRFERLAELDPIELEKRMAEEEDDEEDEEDEEEELYDDDNDDDSVLLSDGTDKGDFSVREDFCESNFCNIGSMRIPSNMKSLVLDLMAEEQGDEDKVSKRLDSWKEVESNTIDMMVELDFRSEGDEWKKTCEQVGEAAMDIELEIFSFLVQELSDELIVSS